MCELSKFHLLKKRTREYMEIRLIALKSVLPGFIPRICDIIGQGDMQGDLSQDYNIFRPRREEVEQFQFCARINFFQHFLKANDVIKIVV